MPKNQTTAQQRARRAASAGGKYTAALRAETTQPADQPVDPFGGHTFDYEGRTDLFRCSECGVYEVTARKDGAITQCTGLAGYGGDTERVYLLLAEHPLLQDWQGTSLARRIRDTGIGKAPRFSSRGRWMLIESAPSVVDALERQIEQMTVTITELTGRSQQVPATEAITRLTAEDGHVILAENYAAYLTEYGEPDRPEPGLAAAPPIRTSNGVEFTPHPGARPTYTCGACDRDRVVLVAIESAGALRWVYACPACGTQTTAYRRDPHDQPPLAYADAEPWTIDHRPTTADGALTTVTAAYLADLGQPVDVLATLPIHDSGAQNPHSRS